MGLTLIVLNEQGASDQTKHADWAEAYAHLHATWTDPENLTARLIDEGEMLYAGPADEMPSLEDKVKAELEACVAAAIKEGYEGDAEDYVYTKTDLESVTRAVGRKLTREEWEDVGLKSVGSAHVIES